MKFKETEGSFAEIWIQVKSFQWKEKLVSRLRRSRWQNDAKLADSQEAPGDAKQEIMKAENG